METQNTIQIPFNFDNEERKEIRENAPESISVLNDIEQILLKLEHLEGLTQVCANAFGTKGALESVNEHDLENTFLSLRGQIMDLEADAQIIIKAITENNARLNY